MTNGLPANVRRLSFLLVLSAAWAAQAQPHIVQQPALTNSIVPVGADLNLRVAATRSGVLRYQWRLNGVRIAGATTNRYAVTNLQVPQGGTYSVAVRDETGVAVSEPVSVIVDVPLLPFTDNFDAVNRTNGNFTNLISTLSGSGRGSNTNATRESGEPLHAGKSGTHSVWLTWTPPLSGVATIDTEGSGFDTLLAVYTGDNLTKLVRVAADDDKGGYLTSLARFNALSNVAYHIAVDGRGAQRGNLSLTWNLRPFHHVATILTPPTGKSGHKGTNVNLSVAFTNDQPAVVQWFFNGTPIKQTQQTNSDSLELSDLEENHVGIYQVRLITAAGDAVDSDPVSVQIHERRDGGEDRQELAAEDKFSDLADSVSGSGADTSILRHRLGGAATKERSPRGRVRAAGGLASGYSGTQIFSTYGATTDTGEPTACGVIGGASMWYAYQAPTNGLLTIDTQGSDFDTVLGVYTGPGTDFASLLQVACAATNISNGSNRWSQVSFAASSGTNYYIAVDAVNGVTGTANLNYHLAVAPTLSNISDQALNGTGPIGPISFVVSDINWPATNLAFTASSSDTNVVPNRNITFGGSGTQRSVTITPAAGQGGATAITVTVTDPDGAAAGVTFVLTVNVAPTITGQPQSQTVNSGVNVKLSVTASGTGPLHYQWQLNGVDVLGATNFALVITNAQAKNGGYYTAIVSNNFGMVPSASAHLIVLTPVQLISLGVNSAGYFRTKLFGLPGASYVLQGSTDLVSWISLLTGAVAQSSLTFTDTASPGFERRLYRVVSRP